MSSISLLVSAVGAVIAAIGSGVLLARCFRAPRGDQIAFSVALLGLLVSLGAQTLGHLSGFDGSMFRAMELGGQVIAPLALVLGLSEVAAKSMAARFCARLYIPALGVVAIVVLALDQLSSTPFTKAWPNPAVYYQTLPDYVLMFAIGPLTALIAIIAVAFVAGRSGQPGWNAVLPAQLIGGAAALLLAYPALEQLVAYLAGVHLPIASEFAVICAAAAALTWLAGTWASRIRLAALRGANDGGWEQSDRWDEVDRTGDLDRYGRGHEQGVYRGGGLYRSDRADFDDLDRPAYDRAGPDGAGRGWQDDASDEASGDWRYRDGRDSRGAGYESDYATGDFEFATGDIAPEAGHAGAGLTNSDHDWRASDGDAGPAYGSRHSSPWQDAAAGELENAAPSRGADEDARSQLFGQIAIYTLLEDRVAEFDQLTERVVELVRSREPNTLVYIVHAVPSAPMQRILYEVYRDREAYEWHTQQPHVRQFDADRRPYVLATNVIELGLQQAKVSPFPSVAEIFGEPGYDTSGFQRPDYLRDYGRTSAQPGGGSRDIR